MAQQPGSNISQEFANAAGNLCEFQLHLFGKNGGENRVMGQQLINKRLTNSYTSAMAVLACAAALLFGCVNRPAHAQGVQTVLHARGRVFPDVGRGAEAIERDPAGHYYVLAAPASVIWIYSPDGKRIGQIPSAQAADDATIKFAVDFDRDAASGRIFVADRGANAVKIFTPEGALEASVPVNAPMSVVALANGEFAVVTLRSDHLVRVMNEHGKLLRSFGNISDAVSDPLQLTAPAVSASADSAAGYAAGYSTSAPPSYAMDIGKLYGGAPGDIYFAFTLLKDPKFRKYDRFGYAGYEAEVSAKALIPDISHDNSQVQLGMRVSGMAGPGEAFSFGSMYSVGNGAAGFAMNGGHGAGGRRAAARRHLVARAGPRLAVQRVPAHRQAAAAAMPARQTAVPPAARRAARRDQRTAPTLAAHYRLTAITARRPAPPPAALQTLTRCLAWGDRVEASGRQEFLAPEPFPGSAADMNIICWAPMERAAREQQTRRAQQTQAATVQQAQLVLVQREVFPAAMRLVDLRQAAE